MPISRLELILALLARFLIQIQSARFLTIQFPKLKIGISELETKGRPQLISYDWDEYSNENQNHQWVKNLPAVQETQETRVRSLGHEDPLEEGMTTHPGFLPGKPHRQRTLEGYNPWELQRVGHD